MPIALPLLKYDRLKTCITTPGGGLSTSHITEPTVITLSVVSTVVDGMLIFFM